MNDDKKLEVIWVQPMREPQLIEIDNDLESMQELVDGYIEEYMPFEDDAAIVCNEEGKMMGLAPNRAIYDRAYAGSDLRQLFHLPCTCR